MNFQTMSVKTKNLKTRRALLAGALAMGMAMTPAVVRAQPDAPAQQGQQGGRRGPGGGRGGERGPNAEQMQQRREENLRRMLTENGFEDENLQDTVVAFANAQDEDRRDSQLKVRRLAQAVQNKLADAEIAALLAEVRADAAAVKTRRAAALAELEEALQLKENPRLDAVLALAGLTDDGIAAFGGPGGRGGFGGRGGEGRGGEGRGGPGGRGPGGRGGGPQRGGERPPMPDA